MRPLLLFLFFLTFLTAPLPTPAAEPQPRIKLPAATSPLPLSATAAAQRRAWLDRNIGRPFAERAQGQPWEAEGLSFVAAAFDHWEPRSPYENDADLAERAAHLRYGLHCQDPLIHCLLGRLQARASFDGFWHTQELSDTPGLHRATLPETAARLERSLDELDSIGTPAAFLRLIALEDSRQWMWINEIPRGEDLLHRATRYLQASLTDRSYHFPGPDEELLVADALGHIGWRSAVYWTSEIREAIENAPLSNWARAAMLGGCDLGAALRARKGTADADFNPAFLEFAESWKLHPAAPEPAQLLFYYSWTHPVPDAPSPQVWFDRVVAARFDWFPPYGHTITWLRNDWAGLPGEDAAFGRACVATGRFDTQVPLFLLHALKCNIGAAGWHPIFRTPENGRALVELGRGLLAEPSRAAQHDLWASLSAVWAWLGGMDQEAADALARIPDGEFHPVALQELQYFVATPEEMKGELAVRLSPARARYLQAEALYDEEKTAEARDAFAAALELANDRPDAVKWLQQRLAIADFEEKYRAGEWMKAPLDLPFWQVVAGTWSTSPDGALVLEGKPGTAFARFLPRLGGDWEIRGEYSFSVPSGDHARPELGLAFRSNTPENFLQCTTWAEEGDTPQLAVTLREGVWTPRLGGVVTELPPDAHAPLRDQNHFYFKTGFRHCTLELNGTKVWDNSFNKLHNMLGEKSRIGFAAKDPGTGNLITIHSLEVRRLPSSVNDP